MQHVSLTSLFLAFAVATFVPVLSAEDSYGHASFYRAAHQGTTASGEIYDARLFTAAHPTLPFGTMVRVTHLKSGNSVVVRVNDRNPFNSGHAIDVSYAAAQRLGITDTQIAEVSLAPIIANHPQNHVQLPETLRKATPRNSPENILKKLVPVTAKSANPRSNVWQNQQAESNQARTQELEPAEDGSSANRPLLRIQFGAFRDQERAQIVRDELRQMNIATMVVHSDEPGTLPLRVITSGVFFEEEDATRWLSYIKHQTGRYGDAFVTR